MIAWFHAKLISVNDISKPKQIKHGLRMFIILKINTAKQIDMKNLKVNKSQKPMSDLIMGL